MEAKQTVKKEIIFLKKIPAYFIAGSFEIDDVEHHPFWSKSFDEQLVEHQVGQK